MTYPITIARLTSCQPYTPRALVQLGVLDRSMLAAPGFYYHLLGNPLTEDLVHALKPMIKVPADKEKICGTELSKVIDYNRSLELELLVDKKVPENFDFALLNWHESLNPMRRNMLPSQEYFQRKLSFDGDYMLFGIGAYVKEQLQAGTPKDAICPKLCGYLTEAAKIKEEINKFGDCKQLRLLAQNADLVFET